MQPVPYPVEFAVEYPDRKLNRLTTFFRLFMVIPIALLVTLIEGLQLGGYENAYYVGGGALLIAPVVVMILFRQKYPRWWFDWNLELMRFQNRVGVYLFLMDDRYPSTDDKQSVHLDFPYPDVERDLGRWMPLVKWLLAIPHYVMLFALYIAVFFAVVFAWFAIVFTGRYPRSLFDFVESVFRWQNRVVAYAFTLVTDRYPPFSFK